MFRFNYLFLLFILAMFYSCSSETPYLNESSTEDSERIQSLIDKYGLEPISQSEYNLLTNSKNIPLIKSPKQLELILSQMNIIKEMPIDLNIENLHYSPKRLKTREEIGQATSVISGSNSDGTATVYIDLITPSVITSTYQLGLMDALVDYTHISGSASKDNKTINFTAYGQGIVKLIWQGIQLYKFNVSITGHCNLDGSNGILTKF